MLVTAPGYSNYRDSVSSQGAKIPDNRDTKGSDEEQKCEWCLLSIAD